MSFMGTTGRALKPRQAKETDCLVGEEQIKKNIYHSYQGFIYLAVVQYIQNVEQIKIHEYRQLNGKSIPTYLIFTLTF